MSSSEVGANFANIENYKCSIKEITVSTEWSTPGELTSGTAVGMAFDCQKKEGRKTFYVVTSPKGKKIALKTVRNAGRCQREAHGMYKKTWDEYVVNEKQVVYVPDDGFSPNNQCRTRENSVPWLSFVYDNVHLSNRFPIRESEQLTVKCFEIGGALGALNYLGRQGWEQVSVYEREMNSAGRRTFYLLRLDGTKYAPTLITEATDAAI